MAKIYCLCDEKFLIKNYMEFYGIEETKFLTSTSEIEAHAATDDVPAVYVGTYGKYNDGSLAGMWVDIDSFYDYDGFIEFCKAIHSDEEDPEFMFQDFQNFPSGYYSECFGEETFDKIKEFCDCDNKDALEAYIDYHGDAEGFEDRYKGEWDSEEDFAWHIANECYSEVLNGPLGNYFDIEAFARDLFFDYHFENGFVFSAN